MRLVGSKRTVISGEEITVEIRNNLPDKSHFKFVVLGSDGSVDIHSAHDNGQISPGIEWQQFNELTLPASSGNSVLGVLALRKETSVDDEMTQQAFGLIDGSNLLGTASVSLEVKENLERAAKEFNAAVYKAQMIHDNLMMSRAGPRPEPLFDLFWSRGLPPRSYSDRRQEKARGNALDSVRAALRGDEKGETAVLFFSLNSLRQATFNRPRARF